MSRCALISASAIQVLFRKAAVENKRANDSNETCTLTSWGCVKERKLSRSIQNQYVGSVMAIDPLPFLAMKLRP